MHICAKKMLSIQSKTKKSIKIKIQCPNLRLSNVKLLSLSYQETRLKTFHLIF